jgi:histidinol-phosphatase
MSEGASVHPELIEFAVGLARQAGELSLRAFFDPGPSLHRGAEIKGDGTEVTQIDLRVEDLLREELGRHVPQDGIHGEERGATAGSSGRHWVIDPIDGTFYFARRMPGFANAITYVDEDGPAVAVVNDPLTGTMLYAGRGHGCWVQLDDPGPAPRDRPAPTRARVSSRTALDGARTQMVNPGTWSEELLLTLHRQVYLRTDSRLVEVADGDADAGVIAGFPMGYEDLAPLTVIVTEAGGAVTDLRGGPVLDGDGSALVTNGLLHQQFLDLLADLPTSRDFDDLSRRLGPNNPRGPRSA